MSGDEAIVFLFAIVIAFFAFFGIVVPACLVRGWQVSKRPRLLVTFAMALGFFLLFGVLAKWSSDDVKSDALYIVFYQIMGFAWVGASLLVWRILGLSYRDDVVERNNPAAGFALAGALLGTYFSFAGGNIGNGPGWWIVVFCATLSTGGLFAGWIFLNKTVQIRDRITIDRDTSSGIHVGSLFIANGIILGRAVAGDWISTSATLSDALRLGCPAFFLFILAAVVERNTPILATTSEKSLLRTIVLPFLYFGLALIILIGVGPW